MKASMQGGKGGTITAQSEEPKGRPEGSCNCTARGGHAAQSVGRAVKRGHGESVLHGWRSHHCPVRQEGPKEVICLFQRGANQITAPDVS